ncbi:MAG: hypothetical protein ABSE25_03515 [Syntrophorhabdales bacterium]|jgi:hypothetical protein
MAKTISKIIARTSKNDLERAKELYNKIVEPMRQTGNRTGVAESPVDHEKVPYGRGAVRLKLDWTFAQEVEISLMVRSQPEGHLSSAGLVWPAPPTPEAIMPKDGF